ncbi:helix-turn-helix domain-containing protein [Paenibacillus sp. NPDC055715]
MFACPHCGAPCKAYDAAKKQWRHLDIWKWRTCLHARVPRTDCKQCNKITLIPVKWSRPLSHFTLDFEAWAMRLMAEMPVNAAARELREHDTRMWRIFHHYVFRAMTELDQLSSADRHRRNVLASGSPLHYLVCGCGHQNGTFCNRRKRQR